MTQPGDESLAAADKRIRDQMTHHRGQLAQLRRERAERLLQERTTGRTVADIADEIGTTPQVVYDLIRAARQPEGEAASR